MLKLRRPPWWAVALTVLGVLLFVRLGMWQLQRAEVKERLLSDFNHASAQPLVPFSSVSDPMEPRGTPHVRVRGRLDGKHLYVLDNQTRNGRPGVLVFVPMNACIDDVDCASYHSRNLLVALGFLFRDPGSRELPHLPPLRDQLIELRGLYAPPPGSGLELGGNALSTQKDWPKLTTYLELDQVSRDLGQPLYPRVLLLDPDPASAYIRVWTPATMPPARHRAYAFQWFSFALLAIVLLLVLNRQRPQSGNDDDHGQIRP